MKTKLAKWLMALMAPLVLPAIALGQSPPTIAFLFGPTSASGVQLPVNAPQDISGRVAAALLVQVVITGSANITLAGSIDSLPFTALPILNTAGQSISAITASGDYWVPGVQTVQATINSISGTARASMLAAGGNFSAIVASPAVVTVAKNSSTSVTVNALGSGGAPVSIGTASAVKVIAGSSTRKSFTVYSETSDVRCMPGTIADVANATAPTSTVGFLIRALTYTREDIAPGNRLDCIALTATTNFDTWEEN